MIRFLSITVNSFIGVVASVNEKIAKYTKEAGEFIMRLAQPMLDTKFGKNLTKFVKTINTVATNTAYKFVECSEWLIDKGTMAAEKAGKAFIRLAVNAKNFANWIADSSLIKKTLTEVIHGVIRTYKKMSDYCTANVESYKYYNQCRTGSRRIVNEQASNHVDEHSILKMFQGVTQQAARQTEQIIDADDVRICVIFFGLFVF